MSSNTLSTASPATTCAQLLHLGTGTQAANSPVRLGDGTLTALSLHNSGIGVADIKLGRLGTAARDVKFADSEGVLHPVLRAVLAADAANSTVTAAQLNMAWEGSSTLRAGTYAIRVMCLCRS